MALTQISDVFIPEVYASYLTVDDPELTAFVDSGVAVNNPAFAQLFSGGGQIAELPFWNDLDGSTEPNYGTDDPADVATPEKITAGAQVARMASLNKGYSASDLASELAGSDAMSRVRERFSRYWMRAFQRRVVSSLEGVVADNVANDDSDMVNDVSGATNADIATGTVFSRDAFTGAAFTSGDHYDDYVAIAVHSVVYKRMVDNDDIDFIPDSQGGFTPTFMGRQVIIDDGLPFTAAGGTGASDSAPKYTSFLFGTGLIGWGTRPARIPFELDREPAQGNGAGVETIWERNSWVIHPFGCAFQSNTLTDGHATLAQLKLATNWDRVVDRKNIPFAALITNG